MSSPPNNLTPYLSVLLCFGLIANLVFGSITKSYSVNKVEDDDRQDLTPYQLKRLVEENVLRKADIAKLPCIRRSRRCLVESIKERGWKNEKKLNKILNTILHIHNERKFIDQAVRLMIEDHSELLKGSKNDEQIIAKYNSHHPGKKRSKKKGKHDDKRSSVPVGFDFLITDTTLNDFNNLKNIEKKSHHEYDEDETYSMFSEEERQYISNLKTKKSQIGTSEYHSGTPYYENSEFNQQGDEAPSWQQASNKNDDQNSDMFSNEFYRQSDVRYFGNNVPTGDSLHSRDSFDYSDDSQEGFQRDNIQPNWDENSDDVSSEPTKAYKPEREEQDKSGSKRDGFMNMLYPAAPYPEPYPGSYPAMYPSQTTPRMEALAKLKAAAVEQMEKMQNVNISIKPLIKRKPKPKKLTPKEKAMIVHKLRQERIKDLYNPKPSDFNSGLEELKKDQDDADLKESIKNLDKGWDLNLDVGTESAIPSAGNVPQQLHNTNTVKKHSPGKSSEKSKQKKKKKNKGKKDKKKANTTKTFQKTANTASPAAAEASTSQEQTPSQEIHYKYPIGNHAIKQNQTSVKEGERNGKTNLPRMIGPTIGNFKAQSNQQLLDVPEGTVKASRVCKPGVMKPNFEGKPNCLIIGDSIALGYSYSASAALNGSCQVQLAPASKAGAAMDSEYGKQCLDYFLSTISLQPTRYDVILFNFGLHDIDYLEKYPEELHSINDYVNNLQMIKKRLLDTGATVGFVLSTPVTYDKAKDDLIRKYNHAAKKAMEEGDEKVMTINLHKIVTRECGSAPFENCYMMKKPHDVHYGVTGSIMLGKRVASAISYLLKKRRLQRSWTALTPSSVDLALNKTLCAVPGTACPASSVCMHNIVSRSGHACCQLHGGRDCGDSWHCCPKGTMCHPQCSDTKCSCITETGTASSPTASMMQPVGL